MKTEESTKPALPIDLEDCHALIVELMELVERQSSDIGLLKQRLHAAVRAQFGRSSEKLSPGQLQLFAEELEKLQKSGLGSAGEEQLGEAQDVPSLAEPRKSAQHPRKKNGGGGRGTIDAALPRIPEHHYPSEGDMVCACCSTRKTEIGQEIQEQLDYVPANFRVIQHVTHKFACRGCEEGVVEGEKPPQIHNGGMPTEGLISQISVARNADHLPLYRQELIYARQGVKIPRSSMGRWLDMSAEAAMGLYDRMHELVLQGVVLQADESPVTLLDMSRPEKKSKKGYAWAYYGDDAHPYVIYDFQPDRTADRAKEFLDGYAGLLLTDGYGGYDWFERERSANCNVHLRRKIEQSLKYDRKRAGIVLALYHDLYEIEACIKGLSDKEILLVRQNESLKIMNQMKELFSEWQPKVPPKTSLGIAINYALPRWDKLCRFTQYACLRPDTNLVENSIRPIAVGRKNWLHIGAESALKTSSIHASLVNTCKRLKLNPFLYLRDIFIRLGRGVDSIDELLPDRWQLQNPIEQVQNSIG